MSQISDQNKGKISAWFPTTNEVAERWTDVGTLERSAPNKNIIKKQTNKQRMLNNPDVKRWYDNMARGSKITAEVLIRRLHGFCQMHDMTPMQLSDLGIKDVRTFTDLLEDHVIMMEDKKYAPSYVSGQIKAAKSWLRHFDV